MRPALSRRSRYRLIGGPALLPLCGMLALLLPGASSALGQSAANAPASVPAGADAPVTPKSEAESATPDIPAKQVREAEDAYLQGAKAVDRKDLEAAEKSFARAVQLNPKNRDYTLALIVTREHRLSELVQLAAKQRRLGNDTRAEQLLAEARKIDPKNAIVAQHFEAPALPSASLVPPANSVASSLGGPVQLEPKAGTQDVHLRGGASEILRSLYAQFGIAVSIDSSVKNVSPVRLDLEGVTFDRAARIAGQITHTFAVPMQPHSAMIADDTKENRDRLKPLVEETLYMPGLQDTQMTEMANLARQVFDLPLVTASPTTDTIVVRGDVDNLKVLNATYDGLLNGNSEVMLDVKLYEIDRTHTRNLGFQIPSSVGIFSVTAEAQQLVSANQSIINQAIASGVIKLTGNTITDLVTEVGFLIATGTVNVAQYSNLLGIFGNGLTLAGMYIGSGATINLLLNSSDIRMLDAVQLRSTSGKEVTFRAGSKYPIITSTYTTGLPSSVGSAVSGLNINGTSVSSLLQQYLGTSSVTVPQIQFEDLGLTLKATSVVLRAGTVQLKLDMKIESLGAGSLNGIPVLNNRQLTSMVTVPAGQTALLASEVSKSETKSVQGLPGLSELPGFQGTTNENKETDTGELLITITPHVVREGGLRIASRPLLMPYNPNPGAPSFAEGPMTQPAPPPAQQQQPQQQPTAAPPRNRTGPGTSLQQPASPPPQ